MTVRRALVDRYSFLFTVHFWARDQPATVTLPILCLPPQSAPTPHGDRHMTFTIFGNKLDRFLH